jgi:hypothetical protein
MTGSLPMGFDGALKQMKAGEKVRRQSWRPGAYLYLNFFHADFYTTEYGSDEVKRFEFDPIEVLANDWQIVEHPAIAESPTKD